MYMRWHTNSEGILWLHECDACLCLQFSGGLYWLSSRRRMDSDECFAKEEKEWRRV